MGDYFNEISRAMDYLAQQKQSVFLGQAVEVSGTYMSQTLRGISLDKLVELPVEEDFQLGLCIGMALAGQRPISIFPRWNFLILATNQLVNHLDKLGELLGLDEPPKVLIRTGIGSEKPLHPGPQHTGDFTKVFNLMCSNLNVVRLDRTADIFAQYEYAFHRQDGVSTLLVEWTDKYDD